MPRITSGRFPPLAALAFAAVLVLGLPAGASAAPPGRGPAPAPAPVGGDGAVLRVRLNGTDPATHTGKFYEHLDGGGARYSFYFLEGIFDLRPFWTRP